MDPTERFVSLVHRTDPEVFLDVFAGLIGVCFEHDAEVEWVSHELDRVAADLEPSFESILAVFTTGRLTGNTLDHGDPRNSYLHRVLQRGLGIPITLSVCAMEIGRRVGVPVHGIGLPGHFMIECDGRYGDPFRGGAVIAHHELERVWQRNTGTASRLDPRFLAPASDRAIVIRMLNNLRQIFVATDDAMALRTLARLRGAFPELQHEQAEHRRWLRHWN